MIVITSRLSPLGFALHEKEWFCLKNVAQHAYLDPIARVIYNISPFVFLSLGRIFFFSAM